MTTPKFKFHLVGHDAEFIIRDAHTHQPVSMAEFTQTTLPTCVIYPDNVMLEMGTDPVPLDDFVSRIEANRNDLFTFLAAHNLYTTIGEAEAEFPKDQLCTAKAHAIGCNPFSSAYMLGVPLVPMPYSDQWRFSGGHIHLAYDKNLVPEHFLVRELDKVMKDQSTPCLRRDAFYGQRGAYRSKPYGLEYRSLDNFWFNDPQWIVDRLRQVEATINAILQD